MTAITISSLPFVIPTVSQLPAPTVTFVNTSTYSFASSDAQNCAMFNRGQPQVATLSSGIVTTIGAQILLAQYSTFGSLTLAADPNVFVVPLITPITLTPQVLTMLFQVQQDIWLIK